jgi:hypothetical protein
MFDNASFGLFSDEGGFYAISRPNSLSSAEESLVANSLESEDPVTFAMIFSRVVRARIAHQAVRLQVPYGSSVDIDGSSFRFIAPNLATVEADVTGTLTWTWHLTLIRENGEWRVFSIW